MAKRQKKSSGFRKFLITCSVLIVAQVAFIALYSSEPAVLTPREAVSAAMKLTGELPANRVDKMRVQVALADYRSRSGSFPANLEALIPDYFDSIPVDPETGKAMDYSLNGGKYRLGVQGKRGPAGKPGVVDDLNIDPVLLASLEESNEQRASYVYDPSGKRDPFLPFDLTPKVTGQGDTELEQYAIGQLRYTSYLGSAGEPIALVENAVRRGFTVRRGTKIGPNGGIIVEILPSKIQILETTVDAITGEKKNVTVEMELRQLATEKTAKKR